MATSSQVYEEARRLSSVANQLSAKASHFKSKRAKVVHTVTELGEIHVDNDWDSAGQYISQLSSSFSQAAQNANSYGDRLSQQEEEQRRREEEDRRRREEERIRAAETTNK